MLLQVVVRAADDLNALSDEFQDSATLENFQRVYQTEGWGANQLQTFDINVSRPGRMVMMPYTSTWFQDYRGVLAFKNVTGDFVVTTDVEPVSRSGNGAPRSQYSLAGIMVRAPRPTVTSPSTWRPGGENYIFLSLGAAQSPGVFQFEVKTTINSVSNLEVSPGASRATIQVARLGNAFLTLRRTAGGSWVVHRRYTRPDLPQTLQVGLTCYTDWPTASTYSPLVHNQTVITGGNPDLIAAFDYFRLLRPVVPAHLAGRNFNDPNQVSDAELLGFLGEQANMAPLASPVIQSHPQSQAARPGQTVTFSVEASGSEPLQFQWRRNGDPLAAPSVASLVLNNVQAGDAGSYDVVVSNSEGSATSNPASLTIITTSEPAPISGTNAPADITIGSRIVVPNPQRFGLNLRDPSEFNNFTGDPGFEPVVIRRQHTATGGGTDFIVNDSGPTTSHYNTMADGFFDGATVRVYRAPADGGPLQFVRSGTVASYVTDGFHRLNPRPVIGTQFLDLEAAPGVNYEYQVRAVDASGNVSTNFSGEGAVTVTAIAGVATGENATWPGSFYRRDFTPPAIPNQVTAAAEPGVVRIHWSANTEADLAGYYVYRRSIAPDQRYRVVLTESGPPVHAGDIYFLEMVVANPPIHRTHDRLHSLMQGDTWQPLGGSGWPYGLGVQTSRDTNSVAPENGGSSSLRIESAGTHEVSIRQPRFSAPQFYAGFYPHLEPGRRYRAEAWLRQTGLSSGTVRFGLTQHYSSIQTNWFGVDAAWRKFSFVFTAPPLPAIGTISEIMIAFNGPGVVWVDNLLLYEDDDADPATNPPFAVRPAVIQALRDYQPGFIRIWTGVDTEYWGVTMDDWTRAEPEIANHWEANTGRRVPDDPYKLPTALQMCRETGGDPWLIVGSFMSESEWLNLIEYLAAPYDPNVDSPATKPYAARRFAQGQAEPWVTVFGKIILEYGNELWNPAFQWNFPSGTLCGQFSEHFFNAAKSSPYFSAVANKIDFMANGWLVSPDVQYGFGHAASLASPSSRYNNIAVYIGGWETGINAGGARVTDAGFQDFMLYPPSFIRHYIDRHVAARDANAAAGQRYDVAVYEGGPGYAIPGPNQPFEPVTETYGKSLAAAVATLDTYLYNSLSGFDPQAYFSFGPGPNWTSHSPVVNGYNPHANWLALQMRNRLVTGGMVSTFVHAAPWVDVPAFTNSQGQVLVPATSGVPLVSAYAFRAAEKYSVFVLSRSVSNATPVRLRLPFTNAANTMLYKLTGDPRTNNITAPVLDLAAEPVGAFSSNFDFALPPGSIYLYVFEGTSGEPAAHPLPIISRAVTQPDPTTTPAALFRVHIDQPSTGLTAASIVLSGTAGANQITITELPPHNGTAFDVLVTGISQSGSIILDIPAGALTGTNGLPSLAALAVDSVIDYAPAPPQNRIVAFDDFDVTPSSGVQLLQGVQSGAGWTGVWQVQNFGPNYTNGYKLASTELMQRGDLLTAGQYAVGGRGYELAFRNLDPQAFGSFRAIGVSPPTIGQDGTVLWASFLLRKESADQAPVHLALVNTNDLAAYGMINIGAGFFGDPSTRNGTRFWTLALRNAANNGTELIVSDAPVVIGETVLCVLEMRFGLHDEVRLYVNPPAGSTPPPTPNAVAVNAGSADIAFRSVRLYAGLGGGLWSGDGLDKGSFDEIRFGDSFLAVTPQRMTAMQTPEIIEQPMPVITTAGRNVVLQVVASGSPPLVFQWRHNGTSIPGGVGDTLVLEQVGRRHSGEYSVRIENSVGSTLSSNATVRVLVPQRLQKPELLPGGAVRIVFADELSDPAAPAAPEHFEIWATDQLTTPLWIRLPSQIIIRDGQWTVDDPEAAQAPQRFYRIIER
jgi:hypothetical protein